MTDKHPDSRRVKGLSVIIPTYNGVAWIRGAINSVLEQQCEVEMEVIVVDDCSTDATVATVRAMGDPRIRCIEAPRNGGVAAARNIGLAAASMDWVGFNDQDDVWCPGRLQRQIRFLEEHPETLGVAGGAGRLAADDRSLWTGRFLWIRWTPILRVRLTNPPFYDPRHDGTTYLQTLILQTEIARRVGGFNEHLPLADDIDFALKVANVATLGWVAGPMFLYRLGHHNQTAPGNADAQRFLGAQAFYAHAQDARSRGEPEPDASQFLKDFRPSAKSVADFHVAQTVRYLNTVWVYRGLFAALLVAARLTLTHPAAFAALLKERLMWWRSRERV